MGRARRKTAQRKTARRTGRRRPNDRSAESRSPETDAALWSPHPSDFLNVVSSFIGFGEATGIELPPLHLKLADMAAERRDLDNALFVGLAELAPHADDRVHARTLADQMTEDERDGLPAWLHRLGHAVATDAARVVADGCDWHLRLLELRVDGQAMTAFLGIDDELAVPAAMAATAAEPLDRIVAKARHPSGVDALVIEVTPAEAGRRMVAALDRADQLAIAPRVPYWPEPCALLRWIAGVAMR